MNRQHQLLLNGICVVLMLSGAACATAKKPIVVTAPTSGNAPIAESDEDAAAVAGGAERKGPQLYVLKDVVINGVKISETTFDLPVTLNSRVEHWVEYFTGRGRGYFAKYLQRSEYFIPFIEPILVQNGMPKDLVYLAMIESGFNNHARSHAKAVGPWQFIASTGRRYGLRVNWWVDERRDTQKSTQAALEYLKDLYSIYRSWELAAASYNAGESKIARAIRRYGTRDFWELSRHRFLRQETRDYVPKIIAAAIVSKNREAFGFTPAELKKVAAQAAPEQETPKEISDAPKDPAETQTAAAAPASSAGPTIEAAQADADKKLTIEEILKKAAGNADVPVASAAQVPALDSSKDSPQFDPKIHATDILQPHVNRGGEVSGEKIVEIEIPSPADLWNVARAAGVPYEQVKALNPEVLRWCTPPQTSVYRVKIPATTKDRFVQSYTSREVPRKAEFMRYEVKSGMTLSRIATKFGIKVDPMVDLNGISPKMPIRAGARILLPMPTDKTRSLASLDIRDPPEKRRRKGKRSKHRGEIEFRVSSKAREAARHKPTSGRTPSSSTRRSGA